MLKIISYIFIPYLQPICYINIIHHFQKSCQVDAYKSLITIG